MKDVVVIGAGWSGLTAAARLASSGRSVTVVEKSRGPGGRSASRRQDGFRFDHGAQYLTARSDAFARQVAAWGRTGLLAPWRPRLAVVGPRPDDAGKPPAERWVGLGGMNAVLRRLADGLDCRWQWRVERVESNPNGWRLESADGQTLTARSVLMTAPPVQTIDLLGPAHPLSRTLESVEMQPCWALMAGFDDAPATAFDAAFVNRGPLTWVARNDAKPGSSGPCAWVAHAGAEWSRAHVESDPPIVARELFAALGEVDPAFGVTPRICSAHRWRYAMATRSLEGPILADDEQKLVVAGDWCAGERIEGAWISGVAAARRLESLL